MALMHHICPNCRKGFKTSGQGSGKCPDCDSPMIPVDRNFKIPAKNDSKAWKEISKKPSPKKADRFCMLFEDNDGYTQKVIEIFIENSLRFCDSVYFGDLVYDKRLAMIDLARLTTSGNHFKYNTYQEINRVKGLLKEGNTELNEIYKLERSGKADDRIIDFKNTANSQVHHWAEGHSTLAKERYLNLVNNMNKDLIGVVLDDRSYTCWEIPLRKYKLTKNMIKNLKEIFNDVDAYFGWHAVFEDFTFMGNGKVVFSIVSHERVVSIDPATLDYLDNTEEMKKFKKSFKSGNRGA